MKIDKRHVMDVFARYTEKYDISDEKIKLKIDHTYRVAAICERIAKSLPLSGEETDLAWLLGILHDIGRFEQLRRYGTFSDAKSIDHAHFGVELLFGSSVSDVSSVAPGKAGSEKMLLRDFVSIDEKQKEFQVIKTAIWNHSAFRIEEGLDRFTEMFCHILRDADKVDIFKVCQDTPLEVIYDVSTEEIKMAEVTEEVRQQFFEQHAIVRSTKKTPVDHLVGYAALAFELVFPESRKIALEQGYLEQILEYPTENPKTAEQFGKLKDFMERFLMKKI